MTNEVIKRAEQILNGMKCRSAWSRGVKVYALELLEALGEAIEGGWFDPDDLKVNEAIFEALKGV